MLPLISSFTDASSGPHGSLSNATADMIWPDVQYPHWYPSWATNPACIGCNASGVPRPSMVVSSSPSCIKARLRQEFTRLPFTCTVHAPHCPWSQPFLVPVRATVSRRQSSSVVRGSTRSWRSLPLMRSVMGTAPSMFGPSAVAAAEPLGPAVLLACAGVYAAITVAAAAPPVVKRNSLRVGSDAPDCVSSSRIAPPFASMRQAVSTLSTRQLFVQLYQRNRHEKRTLPLISLMTNRSALSLWPLAFSRNRSVLVWLNAKGCFCVLSVSSV